jgi:hypothetical protein
MPVSQDIGSVVDLQDRLIRALDSRDVFAIEATSQLLSEAVAVLAQGGAIQGSASEINNLNHALKQNEALKSRVNFLADRNRQKIDKLARLRSGLSNDRYERPGISKV